MRQLRTTLRILLSAALLAATVFARAQGEQQFADLGDIKLESGQFIRNCRIGYRTYGGLNPERTNAVLFPSWFGGKSSDLAGSIGMGKLLDTAGLYVIAVDAIGNGVSSSPSNSKEQPGDKFPAFTVRDMVQTQYRLATEVLHLPKLRAVIGISMGGMQVFQWMVSYPTFLDRAISIVGTPRQTSHDLLLWKSELRTVIEHRGSPEEVRRGMRAVARIHGMHLQTPASIVTRIKAEGVDKFLDFQQTDAEAHNAEDWASQLVAMISHDIYKPAGDSEEKTEKAIKARALVVVVTSDQMVNPTPAIRFAERTKSTLLTLTNDGGHLGVSADLDRVITAVREFIYARD